MPRKRLNLPKWSGELAKPIDLRSVWSPGPEVSQKDGELLRQAKEQKMPLLAKALGLPVTKAVVDDYALRLHLYREIAFKLATLVCPGFQLKTTARTGNFPRKLVREVLAGIELLKQRRRIKSDFEGCLEFLRYGQPELTQSGNKTRWHQRARTLAKLVAEERASQKRQPHLH
jgi:hypothetical protein